MKEQLEIIAVKLPPQALDMEQAVLGACMLESSCVESVMDILTEKSFYKEAHERIFAAISSLHKSSSPVDILTVTQELKKYGSLEIVGGAYYITQLTNRIASSANVEFHARIIEQKYMMREVIRVCSETVKSAYDETSDGFDVIDAHEQQITQINRNIDSSNAQTIKEAWDETKALNAIMLTKKGITGIPCGYDNIDTLTGGWQSTDLIILAARPAMGKTALALNFARNASVDFKIPVAVFSLEMNPIQLAKRLFASESNRSIADFTRRGIETEQFLYIERDIARLINAPLFMDGTPGISLMQLRSKARKLVREQKVAMIFIDYLQLMEGGADEKRNRNREQEISTISRGLKKLAKELEVPIIALSQLSRAVESRTGKLPMLSDLRESGAIEQDADIVIFLHREEYYGITADGNGNSTVGIADIIFAKHRNGPIGKEQLRFIDRLTKFENLEPKLSSMEPTIDFTASNKQDDIPF